jgi:4-aminobutyrate aminotransferase-like enzyme
MNMSDIKRLDREHVIHSWSVQATVDPLVITKTQGVYMWDENGKRYLDMFSQQVNHNIGHQHPKDKRKRSVLWPLGLPMNPVPF